MANEKKERKHRDPKKPRSGKTRKDELSEKAPGKVSERILIHQPSARDVQS